MEGFKFSDLVKPGQGARQALERHLHTNRDREQGSKKRGYRYGGACDLLAAHGTFFTGRELPDKWADDFGPPQHCHVNALTAARKHPELRFFTGLYMTGGNPLHHSWCVDEDDQVVELTLMDTARVREQMGRQDTSGAYFRPFTGSSERVPWVPPAHWVYVGVEYDTEFAADHFAKRGSGLLEPMVPPISYWYGEDTPVFQLQYDPKGWEVTEPDPEAVAAARDDPWDDTFEDDDDEPRPEDQSFLP